MDPRKLRAALRKQGIYVHDAAMANTLEAIEGVVKVAADRTFAAAAQTVDASRKAGDALINRASASWSNSSGK
jgi:hypothetical protein